MVSQYFSEILSTPNIKTPKAPRSPTTDPRIPPINKNHEFLRVLLVLSPEVLKVIDICTLKYACKLILFINYVVWLAKDPKFVFSAEAT